MKFLEDPYFDFLLSRTEIRSVPSLFLYTYIILQNDIPLLIIGFANWLKDLSVKSRNHC